MTRKSTVTLAAAVVAGSMFIPSGSASAAGPNDMPRGDIPGWQQIYAENFNRALTAPVPVGKFSGCNNNPDTPAAFCSGLPQPWRDTLWAYPAGWDDTAKSGNDGNEGAPFGGTYQPQRTVSIGKGYDGTGTLKVAMFRPTTGGDNVVGTVVPRKCMDLADGRYSARVKVTTAQRGFKSAWLRYEGAGAELDYPEVEDYATSNVAAFMHPGNNSVQTSARMTTTHTYAWERRGGTVDIFLDGKKIKTFTGSRLTVSSWIWQNESRIERDGSLPNGGYAAPGNKATIEITWATCYKPK